MLRRWTVRVAWSVFLVFATLVVGGALDARRRLADLQPWLERDCVSPEPFGCGREVCLREHHDRAHAHLPREGEIALDPCDVEVLVARCDHEKRIDIGSDELHPVVVARGRPLEQTCPIQNADESPVNPFNQQPVADSRSVRGSLWHRQAGGDRVLELIAQHRHHSAMNRHHPNWLATAIFLGGNLLAEKWPPAELAKRRAQCIHRLPIMAFRQIAVWPALQRLRSIHFWASGVRFPPNVDCRRLIFAPCLTASYA